MSTDYPDTVEGWIALTALATKLGAHAVSHGTRLWEDCSAAGVETCRVMVDGRPYELAPAWAVELWLACPRSWERLVLTVAQRDPETRDALQAIVRLASSSSTHSLDNRAAEAALHTWCWARWPDGARVAMLALLGA